MLAVAEVDQFILRLDRQHQMQVLAVLVEVERHIQVQEKHTLA
jgi:hypothetical protein